MEHLKKSVCIYCGSTAYGTGCPYSPHKKHVHSSNGDKCIYCGSVSNGSGCPHNPFSKFHLKGIDYNTMVKESIHRSLVTALIANRFLQPLNETPAYKLGLIDQNGNFLKEPSTVEEKAALDKTDLFLLRLRRVVGESTLQLFRASLLLENSIKQENFNAEKYKKECEIKYKLAQIVEDLNKIFTEGIDKGFSKENVENFIFDAIIKSNED